MNGQPTVDRLAALEAVAEAARQLLVGEQPKSRPTVEELEAILQQGEHSIRIAPTGEVFVRPSLDKLETALAALDAASPLTGPVSDRTASNTDAGALEKLMEEVAFAVNYHFDADEVITSIMEHLRETGALNTTTDKAVAITPTPDQGALERADLIDQIQMVIIQEECSFYKSTMSVQVAKQIAEIIADSLFYPALTAAASEARAAERVRIAQRVSERYILRLQVDRDPIEEANRIIQDLAHDIETDWADYEDDDAELRTLATPTQRRHWISLARWRHKKRQSEYEILTSAAEAQCATGPINEGDHVTLYQADDGNWYVRKTNEFQDGRFERIDLATPAQSET